MTRKQSILIYALFLLIVVLTVWTTYLKLDPSRPFTLCEFNTSECVPAEGIIRTNKDSYEEDEAIVILLQYCSKKDLFLDADFILKDGIQIDGIKKTIPVYGDCKGSGFRQDVEILNVPYPAYESTYILEGTLSYKVNQFKTVTIPVKTNPFYIEGSDYITKGVETYIWLTD